MSFVKIGDTKVAVVLLKTWNRSHSLSKVPKAPKGGAKWIQLKKSIALVKVQGQSKRHY